MTFKQLHNSDEPLVIGNIWDVPSAKVAEKLNFKAIATSSVAVANLLGYPDGEEISFSELEFIVKRIAACCQVPLSVDLEAGYSRNADEIVHHIQRLADIGVQGINFEDSVVDNGRSILNANAFSETLSDIKNQLSKKNIEMFLNIRTDAFLLKLPNPVKESKQRIELYQQAGADGIFTPCITEASDIKEIVDCTSLPVNVLSMPDLPDFDTLTALGVKRISMGGFLFKNMYSHLEKSFEEILNQKSFNSIF